MRLNRLGLAVVAFLLVVYPALQAEAQAPPPLPALCYGDLSINGEPAPVGTLVTAKVDGVVRGELVTTEAGKYGGPGLQSKLTVSGDNLRGKMVRFYVSGTYKGTTYSDVFAWEELYWGSGEIMQINLGIKDVESAPQADPPAVPVPNPLPPPTEDSDQDIQFPDTGSTAPGLSESETSSGVTGEQASGSQSTIPSTVQGSTSGSRTVPSSQQRSVSGGSSTFPGSSGVPYGGSTANAAGPEDLPEADEEGLIEAADPGGEAVSGPISFGWAIALGAVIAGVLITIVAGFIVRNPDRFSKISKKAKH